MHKLVKITGLGVLAWLVPFLAAFFFYTPDGVPRIDVFFFKTLMIVIGTIVGMILLVWYFKDIKKDYCTEGWTIGIAWFAIMIVLDLLILLPMSPMTVSAYFKEIGFRYLALTITAIGIGRLLTIRNGT
ncbi:MAG: hypothetical protein H6502_05535 [Candidatus Woesearchaeota archaeon]|nr:MAG: hypothetical protein H6502_05535 [Candidatus Woesearchaeota archaeon]